MRTARPTTDVGRIRRFYEQVVGLPVLWSFVDHEGYDGVVFGVPDETAQLELVRAPHDIAPSPTVEDALVLTCDAAMSGAMIERLRAAQAPEVSDDEPTLNPFWPRNGAATFVDPDGYRLIVAPT